MKRCTGARAYNLKAYMKPLLVSPNTNLYSCDCSSVCCKIYEVMLVVFTVLVDRVGSLRVDICLRMVVVFSARAGRPRGVGALSVHALLIH